MTLQFGSNFKLSRPLQADELTALREAFPGRVNHYLPFPYERDSVVLALHQEAKSKNDPGDTGVTQIACPDRVDEQLGSFLDTLELSHTKQTAKACMEERLSLPVGVKERATASLKGLEEWVGWQTSFAERKADVLKWFQGE